MKDKLKKYWEFISNPNLVFCFFIAWFITNGWAYLLLIVGTYLKISWMIKISGAYLVFIWLPFVVEKIVTIPIAIILLQLLFPNDKKTLAVLKEDYAKLKEKAKSKKWIGKKKLGMKSIKILGK